MDLSVLRKTSAFLNLKKDVEASQLSHAYLVICDDSEVRKGFFELAAITVMCHSDDGDMTYRRIIDRNHLDVKFYDGNEKLNVQEVNKIVEDTFVKGLEGDRKLYFIDNAEAMGIPAQNKLLKTYEEPNDYVTMFLGTANEAGILATIKSRAKKLYIEKFSAGQILEELLDKGVSRELAETAAAYAQGSFEKAEKMAGEEKYQQLFDGSFSTLLTLKNSKQIVDYIFLPMFDKDNISVSLDFFEIILSDALILSTKANMEIKSLNRAFDLAEIRKGFTPSGLAMALLAINEGRKMLFYNVNSTTVIEKILFDILEAKYKWQ